jgi:hypothetical protein
MNKIYDFDISMENRERSYYEMEYKDDYATLMTIFVYNEIDSGAAPIISIDLYDAFPISISDMQMNWGGADIMKLNVTFNFKSWSLRESGKYDLNLDSSAALNLPNIDLNKAFATLSPSPTGSSSE